MRLLAEKKSLLILWAFLTAAGGILMWVKGSMAPWLFRSCQMPAGTPGFTAFFLLWILLYGLYGVEGGMTCLFLGSAGLADLLASLAGCLSYILLLSWYPLFFSILHGILAALVLFFASILHTVAFLRFRFSSCILWTVHFFASLLELYFLYVTIAFAWVK